MRINWVIAADCAEDVAVTAESMKAVGPIWGSHRTWRAHGTDNVVCHDLARARQLADRAFQAVCNFYVPKKFFVDLGRPLGIKLYEGDFDHQVNDIEDIVALHLAARNSDVVLLLGFDFSLPKSLSDRLQSHMIQHRHGLLRGAIASNPEVQWVVLDPARPLDSSYLSLANLTCDTSENALKLLI